MLGYLITGCATLGSLIICPTKNRPMPKTLYHKPARAGAPSRSRDAIYARALHLVVPLLRRGRRECRVRAAPAVSCAKNCTVGAHEHTGERKHSDIPCATALRLTSCSPRWSGLVVTVIPEKRASQELDASIAASGPHDFAVRPGVFVRRDHSRLTPKRPSHPAPHVS